MRAEPSTAYRSVAVISALPVAGIRLSCSLELQMGISSGDIDALASDAGN
jgi:hypothetical protein